jgi:tRNA (guanine-N7-)-methyltransferase
MMALDPDEYIITRKRKKYRFALFANSPLCFEYEAWRLSANVDVVEVGAGTGLFSVELATRFPEKQFLAIDVKADRLQKGARIAEAQNLSNIRFLRARADQLTDCITQGVIERIWVTFPDPFPKGRSAKHRLIHPEYLKRYATVLKDNGTMCFKTDDHPLFDWSIEQLVSQGWLLSELSFDLHDSALTDTYKIMTTYERRWTAEGKPTHFVKAHPTS